MVLMHLLVNAER